MSAMFEDVPLFDMAPVARRASEPVKRSPRKVDPNKIWWSNYRPVNRLPCDECLQRLVLAGKGPVARDARYKRIHQAADLLLCTAHAQAQRKLDKLPPLKIGDER
jgi:hypothetical protein